MTMTEPDPDRSRRSQRPRRIITFRRHDIQPSELQLEAVKRYREQVQNAWVASQTRPPFDGDAARRLLERHRRRVIREWLSRHPDSAA
jgi:hypothetical protein